MSTILCRRLFHDKAPRQLILSWRRRTQFLATSFESLTLNNGLASTDPLCPFVSSRFSSAASEQKIKAKPTAIKQPSNLIFDPRCVSSPFHGMDPVSPKKKNEDLKVKSPKKLADSTSVNQSVLESSGEDQKEAADNVAGANIHQIEEDFEIYDDEDEEYDGVLYDLATKPDIPRAIPLPERLHVPIMDIRTGEKVGTFHLSERTFGCDPVRVDILQRVVVYQRNKKRGRRNAGARTKTISEVSGSGRKVRPQKGSGRARAGHSRPAHWRGGAKAHGPKGRIQDYTTKLNKKVRKMGIRHALSQKLKEGNLIVTTDLNTPTHKTKKLSQMLQRFGVTGKDGATALMLDDADPEDAENKSSVHRGLNVNFKVASGNLYQVKVRNHLGCNVYDMLKFQKLFLSLPAVRTLEERLERDL